MSQAKTDDTTNLSAALDRGDVDGALEAIGLPRRGFLAGLAALVPGLATGSAAATESHSTDDAKLVHLAGEIAEL